jgi:hypothetical protein
VTTPAPATATTRTPTTPPAAATTPPPRITTERSDVHFRTPSGNIHCYLAAGDGVTCDVGRHDWPIPSPPPQGCEGYGDWVPLPSVTLTGAASIAGCASDSRWNAPRVLPYGTGVVAGGIECVSQPTGLTCRSTKSGHGFSVSRERYRLF